MGSINRLEPWRRYWPHNPVLGQFRFVDPKIKRFGLATLAIMNVAPRLAFTNTTPAMHSYDALWMEPRQILCFSELSTWQRKGANMFLTFRNSFHDMIDRLLPRSRRLRRHFRRFQRNATPGLTDFQSHPKATLKIDLFHDTSKDQQPEQYLINGCSDSKRKQIDLIRIIYWKWRTTISFVNCSRFPHAFSVVLTQFVGNPVQLIDKC